jgi:hypothetical protein
MATLKDISPPHDSSNAEEQYFCPVMADSTSPSKLGIPLSPAVVTENWTKSSDHPNDTKRTGYEQITV